MPDTPRSLRLIIVAADPLARAGLALRLADEDDIVVVGQVAPNDDGLDMLDDYDGDVVLWDLGWDPVEPLPDLTALERPSLALLPDDTLVTPAWHSGARAMLLRDADPATIAVAAHALVAGLVVLAPPLAAGWPGNAPLPDDDIELTPRESEVLNWLAEGLTNRAIAGQLNISEHTVKFHVNAIMGKLGAQSRTDAVVRATRRGWLSL